MDQIQWPERVPVLSGKTICRRALSDGSERHCLVGWIHATFSPDWNLAKCEGRMHSAALLVTAKVCDSIPDGDILNFNNNDRQSTEQIAALWNRTMEKLGYVRCGSEFVRADLVPEPVEPPMPLRCVSELVQEALGVGA